MGDGEPSGLLPIRDESGYEVTESDLTFLRLSVSAVKLWQTGAAPLGMDAELYEHFVGTLARALELDELDDVDVRLKGSSAAFFSGPHKVLPSSRDVFDCFRERRDRLPDDVELKRIKRALNKIWPDVGPRPIRRPFDSMYRIEIDRDRSDYDLQISSQEVDRRARDSLLSLGLDPTARRINSPTYNFVRKDLVTKACPHLNLWTAHISDVLGRIVTVAVFDECGPPRVSAAISSQLPR